MGHRAALAAVRRPIVKVGEAIGPLTPSAAAGAADEGRLAAAELAADEDDVSGLEPQRPSARPRPRSASGPSVSSAVNCEQVELTVRTRARRIRILRLVGARRAAPGPAAARRAAPAAWRSRSRRRSSTDGVRSAAAGWKQRIHEHGAAAELVYLRHPGDPGDPGLAPGDLLGREVPQRRDHPRLDQLDLALEVRPAGLDLLRLRIAVARRARLQDVGDEHVLAAHPDLLEQPGRAAARRGRRTAGPAGPPRRPGASPTKIRSASALPEPKTTLVRSACNGQRVQPATSR